MPKNIVIEGEKIGEGCPVFIIAEAGVNHNGSLKMAKEMVDAAKSAGADAIKFQTFTAENLVTARAPKALYQKKNALGKNQLEMLKKLELSNLHFKELFDYCQKKRIIFLSTPFDSQSALFLQELGVGAFKVSSGDLPNLPLLKQIAGYKKPVILSTGMSSMKEIGEAVNTIVSVGNQKLILLHCTTNYPTKYEEVNLKAIETLRKRFKLPVGYSDHTAGVIISVAAVALRACVIEKHFTLSQALPGPDHLASLEPNQLREMVRSIREIEKAMGSGEKVPTAAEVRMKKIARKSLVANVDIPRDAKINAEMLAIKRPGTGIEPRYLTRLMKYRTKKSIRKDQVLFWEDIK
jgi:N-acetylneuraminate synthase/N,N'-diacetyllegionaminate synthase